jgi:maleylacetoacetate isomerase
VEVTRNTHAFNTRTAGGGTTLNLAQGRADAARPREVTAGTMINAHIASARLHALPRLQHLPFVYPLETSMKLHTYFRSSAAYRVRIALHLKGIDYEAVPVHLLRDGGQHKQPAYLKINPSGMVPTMQDERGTLTQSMAILEYLEETHPAVPLLPPDPLGRARVRELAQIVACDIHPLTTLRGMQYLADELGIGDDAQKAWLRHWIEAGLHSVESHLARHPGTGKFCHGETPTMADCFLVPQVFNAIRLGIDPAPYQNVARIYANCVELPAFVKASPGRQADAE